MGTEHEMMLKFVGVEFLPPNMLFLNDSATARKLLEAAHSGQLDLAQLPLPTLPIRQIFADQQGDHYLVVPTDGDSPVALPYITGSELSNLTDTSQGGFMPVEQLIKASSSAAPSSSTSPDPAKLIGQLTTELAKSLAQGESVGGAALGQLQSQLAGLVLRQVPEQFRGIAGEAIKKGMEKAPQLLNDLMRSDPGGSMKNLLGDLNMGNVASMAAGSLVDQGFSALADTWKVDDNSSTLEHVAHQYGMEALGEVKGYVTEKLKDFVKEAMKEGLTSATDKLSNGFGNTLEDLGKKFDLFFNGMKSNAILPAAYITSKDNKADVVITGFPTVFVDGQPISRITDLLDPSKKIILEGAATVLAGGLPVGRVTSDTAIPSDLVDGAKTVLIGGPSVRIASPITLKSRLGQPGTLPQKPQPPEELPQKPQPPYEKGIAEAGRQIHEHAKNKIKEENKIKNEYELAKKNHNKATEELESKAKKLIDLKDSLKETTNKAKGLAHSAQSHVDHLEAMNESAKATDLNTTIAKQEIIVEKAKKISNVADDNLSRTSKKLDDVGSISNIKITGKLGKIVGVGGKGVGVVSDIIETYDGIQKIRKDGEEGNYRDVVIDGGKTIGGLVGGAAGAATGAAAGTLICPVIGTAAGAVIGAFVGAWGFSILGREIGAAAGDAIADSQGYENKSGENPETWNDSLKKLF